ncbi:MAG TPA: phosphate signaling complex protein PhoU [Candidatus Omnitrophota bacterium]|nr:phosphate signaling complex protein PhoU [Candidatus Omnitrophota bacterium]
MERRFLEELKVLREKLFQMGLIVEAMIEKAVNSLLKGDNSLGDEVFADENMINALEIEIDEMGHALLALAQPVAVDLRLLTMILKINTDLERMGDHAVNIAQRSRAVAHVFQERVHFSVVQMSDLVQKILRDAMDCFMNENTELARRVLASDDQVDACDERLCAAMVEKMQEDPSCVHQALNFVMIGHNLERIADLANNIAENTIYYKQGRDVRHHYETT